MEIESVACDVELTSYLYDWGYFLDKFRDIKGLHQGPQLAMILAYSHPPSILIVALQNTPEYYLSTSSSLAVFREVLP